MKFILSFVLGIVFTFGLSGQNSDDKKLRSSEKKQYRIAVRTHPISILYNEYKFTVEYAINNRIGIEGQVGLFREPAKSYRPAENFRHGQIRVKYDINEDAERLSGSYLAVGALIGEHTGGVDIYKALFTDLGYQINHKRFTIDIFGGIGILDDSYWVSGGSLGFPDLPDLQSPGIFARSGLFRLGFRVGFLM
ncbi:hypothetical protein N9B82_05875 [Saprospiraceae bacterium]|nr:hypothetical protein [Saprospiraceae bacterium]